MLTMDGWEATRLILERHDERSSVGRGKKKLIIYGLTGHVGKEYREKCLEAGMSDVLEKPITIEKLRKI